MGANLPDRHLGEVLIEPPGGAEVRHEFPGQNPRRTGSEIASEDRAYEPWMCSTSWSTTVPQPS